MCLSRCCIRCCHSWAALPVGMDQLHRDDLVTTFMCVQRVLDVTVLYPNAPSCCELGPTGASWWHAREIFRGSLRKGCKVQVVCGLRLGSGARSVVDGELWALGRELSPSAVCRCRGGMVCSPIGQDVSHLTLSPQLEWHSLSLRLWRCLGHLPRWSASPLEMLLLSCVVVQAASDAHLKPRWTLIRSVVRLVRYFVHASSGDDTS